MHVPRGSSRQQGFSIIEITIVVILLALLALFTFIVLDPFDMQKKAHDAKRKDSIADIGRAIYQFQLTNTKFPTANAPAWYTSLINSGDLKFAPTTSLPLALPCTSSGSFTAAVNSGFCYKTDALLDQFVVFTLLVSDSERRHNLCSSTPHKYQYYMISSTSGKTGYLCINDTQEPKASDNVDP